MHRSIVCNHHRCRNFHLKCDNLPLYCFCLLVGNGPIFPFKLTSGFNLVRISACKSGVRCSANKLIVILRLIPYLLLAIPFKFNIVRRRDNQITDAKNDYTVSTLAANTGIAAAAAAAAKAIVSCSSFSTVQFCTSATAAKAFNGLL